MDTQPDSERNAGYRPPMREVRRPAFRGPLIVELDCDADSIESAAELLSAAETARAERFQGTQRRRSFVNTRAALRLILGRALECPPAEIGFAAGPWGKLAVAAPAAGRDIEFSVSHADGRSLIALGGTGIGVDIERRREVDDWPSIARQTFDPGVVAWLSSLRPAEADIAFLQAWTLGEAVAKALGLGLAGLGGRLPLTAEAVRRASGERRPVRLQVRGTELLAGPVECLAPGFVAAAAVGAGAGAIGCPARPVPLVRFLAGTERT